MKSIMPNQLEFKTSPTINLNADRL